MVFCRALEVDLSEDALDRAPLEEPISAVARRLEHAIPRVLRAEYGLLRVEQVTEMPGLASAPPTLGDTLRQNPQTHDIEAIAAEAAEDNANVHSRRPLPPRFLDITRGERVHVQELPPLDTVTTVVWRQQTYVLEFSEDYCRFARALVNGGSHRERETGLCVFT
jgi:hypothetical protein